MKKLSVADALTKSTSPKTIIRIENDRQLETAKQQMFYIADELYLFRDGMVRYLVFTGFGDNSEDVRRLLKNIHATDAAAILLNGNFSIDTIVQYNPWSMLTIPMDADVEKIEIDKKWRCQVYNHGTSLMRKKDESTRRLIWRHDGDRDAVISSLMANMSNWK